MKSVVKINEKNFKELQLKVVDIILLTSGTKDKTYQAQHCRLEEQNYTTKYKEKQKLKPTISQHFAINVCNLCSDIQIPVALLRSSIQSNVCK